MDIKLVTTKMSETLKDFKTGNSLNFEVNFDSPFICSIIPKEARTESEWVLSQAFASLLASSGAHDSRYLFDLTFREADYFIRNNPRVSAVSESDSTTFNEIKNKILEQIWQKIESFDESKHELSLKFFKMDFAIKHFLVLEQGTSSDIELVDIEEEVVIVKLRENLDKPSEWLEKLAGYLSQLFQDDKINVIPE